MQQQQQMRIFSALLLLVSLMAARGNATVALWPQFGRSAQHGFASALQGPISLPRALWNFSVASPADLTAPPCLSPDGAIVFLPSTDGVLHALRADTGAQLWFFAAGGAIGGSPAADDGGSAVFIGCEDGALYSLSPLSGALLWRAPAGNKVTAAPVAFWGRVFVGSLDGAIYAFNASTGAQLWRFATHAPVNAPPAVSADGARLFAPSTDGTVYALDIASGALAWTHATGGQVWAAPAATRAAVFVAASDALSVLALAPTDGSVLWARPVKDCVFTAPALTPSGNVVVGLLNGNMVAFDAATGAQAWEVALVGMVRNSAAVGADGTVFVSTSQGALVALRGDTGAQVFSFPQHPPTYAVEFGSPVIGAGGVLFVSAGGTLLALQSVTVVASSQPPPCSLNGVLNPDAGTCSCFGPWGGPTCSVLTTGATPPTSGYGLLPPLNAWGGNVAQDADGVYHLFVAEMANDCPLRNWGTASFVTHATAPSPLGPFQKQDAAIRAWSHNPQVLQLADGTFAIFHIGSGSAGRPPNCTPAAHAASASGGSTVHTAPTLGGPWTPFPNFGVPSCNNPAPLQHPNGTLYLVCNSQTIHAAPGLGGPWTQVAQFPAPHDAPVGSYEDAFIWLDPRGAWHALFHVWSNAVPLPYTCAPSNVSAHAFSRDGVEWWFSPTQPYGTTVHLTDGSTFVTPTRERPKLFFGVDGEPAFLFNGAVRDIEGCAPSWCSHCKMVSNHTFNLVVPLVAESGGAPLPPLRVALAPSGAAPFSTTLGVDRGPGCESGALISAQLHGIRATHIRTHDAGVLDWCVLFPNASADTEDPASYEWAAGDAYFLQIVGAGFVPYVRLGTSWSVPSPACLTPDPAVFSRVSVNTVRHYTEGWGGGCRYDGEVFLEIWNEVSFEPPREQKKTRPPTNPNPKPHTP